MVKSISSLLGKGLDYLYKVGIEMDKPTQNEDGSIEFDAKSPMGNEFHVICKPTGKKDHFDLEFTADGETAEKVKNIIEKCATRFKKELRGKLDALPPKTRLGIVLAAFAVFASLCLYMTATAIIGFGKGEKALEIRRIEKFDLHGQESMDQYNNNVYGKGTEEE